MPHELREPVKTLGLDWPVSLEALKARYKELAKRHHPDANGGDRASEERLRVKRQTGSHRVLSRGGWRDYIFSFHDNDELGPRILARIARDTGLRPEDL